MDLDVGLLQLRKFTKKTPQNLIQQKILDVTSEFLRNEAIQRRLDEKKDKRKRQRRSRSKKDKFLKELTQHHMNYDDVERHYRSLDDRRGGIVIGADQHRFSGKIGDQIFFINAPPLDYSYAELQNFEDIVSGEEPATMVRNFRHPVKTKDDHYLTSSLRLSYNNLESMDGLQNLLFKILHGGPLGLVWLDLSFNNIEKLDVFSLTQIPNVRIFYLHSNSVADILEIKKLRTLKELSCLTLQGNAIEKEPMYRRNVLMFLPRLRTLDFVAVTRVDLAETYKAAYLEPYWQKRHLELEKKAKLMKVLKQISLTQRLLNEMEDTEPDYTYQFEVGSSGFI